MKKYIILFMCSLLLLISPVRAAAEETPDLALSCDSAALMEISTGTLLYEKDAYTHRAPASVTKVMTLLLVLEAIEAGEISLNQSVTASEHAASMGGSQIWLEYGESMTVDEMLKCVAVVSANDCAVALAELVSGSEEAFVKQMNKRAQELGMENTHFENCTGLFESETHYSCAYDIALAGCALMKCEKITDYTTIWTDTVRNGEFTLSNTNKLLRSYQGTTGLKTGFTTQAMYCLAATAERDGEQYIAVVLHAPGSIERFNDARSLLDYAFCNYDVISLRPELPIPAVPVTMGAADAVAAEYSGPENLVVAANTASDLYFEQELCKSVSAPVTKGQRLGVLVVKSGEDVMARLPICAMNDVARLNFWQLMQRYLLSIVGCNTV